METRVRFAPSPTGYLHVGGARTALFNWLYAKQTGGKLILRIEDTDQSRSTDESIQQILASMEWLGLDYDEYYRQTERVNDHLAKANALLAAGKAYWCDCSAEQLDLDRQDAMKAGKKPMYSGRCRDRQLQKSPSTVLRFLSLDNGGTSFMDLVRGELTVQNSELDDFIILRSDGTPTYNFCVVVDDASMRISHVIRGEDHISNTFRQIQVYQALGSPVPHFAHIPLILGKDKKRLSKRHGASSVLEYKDQGHLPDALLNYLALLGWSHDGQEEFTRAELIKLFTLNGVSKSGAVFDSDKLQWLNGRALQKVPVSELLKLSGLDLQYARGVPLFVSRSKTLVDLREQMQFLDPDHVVEYDQKDVNKFFDPLGLKALVVFRDRFAAQDPTEAGIKQILTDVIEQLNIKMVKAAQAVRLALSGRTATPGLYEIIDLMGKDLVLQRIDNVLKKYVL